MAFTDVNARHRTANRSAHAPYSLKTLVDVWKSRRALARLDRHALTDVGIDAARAQKESAKPIWDVPATWRK
ncbi:MAG: hypothetical protein AB3N11_17290 [Arenibacterium sp.]